MQVSFEGNLNAQDDELSGTWTQLRKKYPVTFHRIPTNAQSVAGAEKDYGQGLPDQIQGHWKVYFNGRDTRNVINIAQMPDGTYSATFDDPDQGDFGFRASEVTVTYPNIHIEWQAVGGAFDGKLNDGKLSGTWRQGKYVSALQLERDKNQ